MKDLKDALYEHYFKTIGHGRLQNATPKSLRALLVILTPGFVQFNRVTCMDIPGFDIRVGVDMVGIRLSVSAADGHAFVRVDRNGSVWSMAGGTWPGNLGGYA